MRIDPTKKIGGQSPLLVRKLLHYYAGDGPWSLTSAKAAMGVSAFAARKVVEELERLEYIVEVPHPDKPKVKRWKNTELGNQFAVAPASKPVTRETAEKRLAEFLERVKAVCDDPYYLYRVGRVTLFGSILSDKSLLGDVDIAIQLIHKEPDKSKAEELDKERRQKASREGRRFSNYVDYLAWPKVEIFLFLKARSRVLSLCLESESFLKKCETKIIYTDE